MIFGAGLLSYIQLGAYVPVPSHVMRDCVFSEIIKRTRLMQMLII